MNYDPILFKSTAKYYVKYRPGYPEKFFNIVAKRFKLDGTGRLLDLGSGPGKLAIPFAKYFDEVTAMDPDKGMLSEGRRLAKKNGIKNITWVVGDSYTLSTKDGKFRLAVLGRSFHWMKRQEILKKLFSIIEPGGGVVIVSDHGARYKWNEIAKEVIRKYLGPVRHAGIGRYRRPPGPHAKIINNSKFKKCVEMKIPYKRFWTAERITKYHFTTSFASDFVLGKKARLFEKEMFNRLKQIKPKGKFVEVGFYDCFFLFK